MRMASIGKRLEAHQKAYALWRKLATKVHQQGAAEIIEECQEWWPNNCLYLDKDSREAFYDAYWTAAEIEALRSGTPTPDVRNIIKDLITSLAGKGDTILKSAALPPLAGGELAKENDLSNVDD